jgi:hypothetical protein
MITNFGADLLDRERFEERVAVHHSGDASTMLDIVRTATIFDTMSEYDRICDLHTKGDIGDGTTVGVYDRFKAPSPSGYRDLRFYVESSNGHIGTIRYVRSSFIDAHEQSLNIEAQLNRYRACLQIDSSTYFVVITDNFNFALPSANTLITGFPDLDSAILYAKLRTYQKVHALADEASSMDDLKRRWFLFGEDALTAGFPFDGRMHVVSFALNSLFLEAPVYQPTLSWHEHAAEFSLEYQALDAVADESSPSG